MGRRNHKIRSKNPTSASAVSGIKPKIRFEQNRKENRYQRREMREAKELDDPTPFFAQAVPRVTYNGMTAGPLAMQVKNTKDFNEHVMAELTATNLEYMRIAVLQRAAEHDAQVQRKAAEAAQAPVGRETYCVLVAEAYVFGR